MRPNFLGRTLVLRKTKFKTFLIMLSFHLFTLTSPIIVEKSYTVILHTSMGLTVDQVHEIQWNKLVE